MKTGDEQNRTLAALGESVALMARLRGPDGCPWDREQTFDSIKRYTLEETYEVFDAIERRDWDDLRDELGDLLLQVLFYAQMASDEGTFTVADVAESLNRKLVRRHPHVFGDVEATSPDAVLRNWEQIKKQEKRGKVTAGNTAAGSGVSLLDDVPRTMPATLEATKLGSRASKAGFDWPDASGLFAKVEEELGELREEVAAKDQEKVSAEFGDLLFTMLNLARHLDVDPESALRSTNAKFRRRFSSMEQAVGGGDKLSKADADTLEELWSAAKLAEASSPNSNVAEERA